MRAMVSSARVGEVGDGESWCSRLSPCWPSVPDKRWSRPDSGLGASVNLV